MLRVLHVIDSLDQRSGGPLRAVLDLSAMSEPLGLHSEILGLGALSVADNPVVPDAVHSLPHQGLQAYGFSSSLRPWCRLNLNRFDAVILHGLWSYANWAVSRECIAARIPYICFPHGMLDLWSVHGQGRLKWWKKIIYWHCIEKRIVGGSDAVFFTLRRELENARKTFTLPPIHPFIVAPFGILPRVVKESDGLSAAGCIAPREKIALFMGRVDPKKRPDLLIRAWSEAKIEADWRLVIAGPGERSYLTQLADLARRCGVQKSVEFIGYVAGVQKELLLARASWFLLPSEQENFGIVVLEAVASGCAVAISDQVYLADEFPAESEILAVRLDAWTGFMRARMRDNRWRDETAHRGQAKLLEQFSQARVGRGWVDAIRAVVKGRTSQSAVPRIHFKR